MTDREEITAEIAEEPVSELAAAPAGEVAEKKPHHKALKIVIVVLLEIALLGAGLFFGYTYAKSTIEPILISNYRTLEDLREYYRPSSADMNKDAAAFAAEENYFGMYKRVYYALLTAPSVNVAGDGTTATNGGTVSIDTVKKVENGLMYLHTVSTGTGLAGTFGGEFDLKQYFDIESQFAKVEKDGVIGKVQPEQTFVAKYGLLPYGFSNYTVEEETIDTAAYETADGLHVLTLTFLADAAENYLKQMKAYSGQIASFADGDIQYKMFFDDGFVLRKTEVTEKYTVMSMPCTAELTDVYTYGGEDGYSPMEDAEKFSNVGA
ncbi:MAG: hypothetical protein DBX59_11175 [Bacillota bacterium]|nr:MAG: hypothetical protein DBX59_11175 [Bacillota bacterium]